MNVRNLLENHGFPIDNVSDKILDLDFGDSARVEKYGVMKWDLFNGAKVVCDDCEAVINFEDNEFFPLTVTYFTDDGFSEFSFDSDVCPVLLNVNGDEMDVDEVSDVEPVDVDDGLWASFCHKFL